MANDLETFREQWKKELQHIVNDHSVHPYDDDGAAPPTVGGVCPGCGEENIQLDKHSSNSLLAHGIHDESNDETSQDAEVDNKFIRATNTTAVTTTESTELEYYPFKILTQFLNEAPKRFVPRRARPAVKQASLSYTKRKYFNNESADSAEKRQRVLQNRSVLLQEEGGARKNMLDLFLADLDEINEIPFFDSTLPREVAIKIFQHLDMKSLCSCSQVSHSWRSLADDELLWCGVSHSLGYDTDLHVSDGHGWKEKVRQRVEEKRLLNANWKARTGKPYNLSYPRGGILCAVHSCGSNIVAGYTSCNVRSWNTKTGDVCTFNASNTALVLDESAEELGRIHNEIKQVSTTAFVTAASFRHGFVDVWRNEGGTDPIHTFTFSNPDITSLSACDVDSRVSLVAASQGTRVQVCELGEEVGECLSEFDLSSAVTKLDWLSQCPSSSLPRLLITGHNTVYVKAVSVSSPWNYSRQDEKTTEVHNVIWAPITSVGFRRSAEEVAVGFNLYAGPSTQIKVNVYDLIKNNLITTLTGHTWIVSCIFMPDTPSHQLVTGSGDRKIRLYDLRAGVSASLTLVGHAAKITAVEMDDWKVVSGDEGGFVCVWDQRMCRKLWDVRNRHPVQYCHFDDRLLIIGNVPYNKFPETDEFEVVSSLRYRGTVQVYDFLANQQTQGIPDICLSSYSDPEASNYNIGLVVPYDVLS
ncbi:unnamed protein product [Candidula unifasciata]|uniref:F-box domain-containing protein n=1 Tax=Candidula unifasciata TaxID=100452 RepID=A0A8S3Z0X6_9EUPU|nr:unnamed protein product [Candidula unifasciata]